MIRSVGLLVLEHIGVVRFISIEHVGVVSRFLY